MSKQESVPRSRRDPELEQRWRGHVAAWRAGGVSARSYCQEHGLSVSSLYGWSRKLAELAFHFASDEMTAAGDVFYLERPPFMSNAQFAEYIRFMAKSFKGGAWRSFGKPDDLQVWSNHPAAGGKTRRRC